MKTEVILRGSLARRPRLTSALKACIQKTLKRCGVRVAHVALRIEPNNARDSRYQATLIVHLVRGHALLVGAVADQPWKACAQASQNARKQLDTDRKRSRARLRRAQRVWSQQRWLT